MGGQRSGKFAEILREISIVVAKKTQENLGDNDKTELCVWLVVKEKLGQMLEIWD